MRQNNNSPSADPEMLEHYLGSYALKAQGYLQPEELNLNQAELFRQACLNTLRGLNSSPEIQKCITYLEEHPWRSIQDTVDAEEYHRSIDAKARIFAEFLSKSKKLRTQGASIEDIEKLAKEMGLED
jgi:hypothetical protein